MRRDEVTLALTVTCAKKVSRAWEGILEKPVLSVDLVPTKAWSKTVHSVPEENMGQASHKYRRRMRARHVEKVHFAPAGKRGK